jgi:D-sedoheptulose 7-phosphate isomerase
MEQFSRHFLADTVAILGQVDRDAIEASVETLRATRDAGGRLFFCGSGGGAGHASHAACDFRKLGGFEAYCVTDNVSELTARVNDEGWDSAYANWLRASRLGPRDCLFVFSVGGGSLEPAVSTNLVQAMELAQEVGAAVVGVAGRDGGVLAKVATACILLTSVDPALVTPQTEGLQALMWHLIVSHPRLAVATAKWEGIESAVPAVPS